ncbi:hypothetical protein FNV43_RR03088 [Rhamnella rubrinervis]|uniref:Uncharacterized protein n=1 Tax=Rhamnella rubrinervis TaxID=2594499 RepID=A0A8K0HJ36_9ROSA|nr:hypothetical protein FNV43_RR03088 [Rhamnella rubrinervis]
MGSEYNLHKHHYDITMSRRTRNKPLNVDREANYQKDIIIVQKGGGDLNPSTGIVAAGEQNGHKSLKQLISVDNGIKAMVKSCTSDEGSRGRSSLGQHFTEEEKNLQLVRTQQKEGGPQGRKLKKMVSRYAKVLSHLINAKRDTTQKKPILRLTM